MRIYTGLTVLLFILFWNFSAFAQPCINSWNSCAPVYETEVISPSNVFSTVPWQSAYATYETNFTYAKYYKVNMSHASGSVLLSNVQMYFDSSPIYSNTGFQYTGGDFYLEGDLLGNASPGAYEELNFEVYERNILGIYVKGITFKFTLTITCSNNMTISLPATNATSSIGKYESNGYLKVSAAQANTGTGQLNFDGQNYVEFLPGAALTVTNGSMEAYIDGCGGVKSGGTEETQTVGFSEETKQNISLSPNPNTGRAMVYFNGSDNEKHIWLYDASGRLLQEKVTSQRETELDVSNEPNGLYFLHVEENSQRKVLKIIKE